MAARGTGAAATADERRGRALSGSAGETSSQSNSDGLVVRLLGHPAVRVGGRWVPLRPTKAGAVVAYVACRGGRVSRGELATVFWPGFEARRAATNLRQLLHAFASGPCKAVLERGRDAVRLRGECDLQVMTRALDEARWADAVPWYEGPLLDGFEVADAGAFGAWLARERRLVFGRWRCGCLAMLDELASNERYPLALQLADRLLAADALDEVAVRHAIRAAVASGDTHGARQRFEAFCDAVRGETGAEPDDATLRLGEAIGEAGTLPPLEAPTQRYGRRASDVAVAALAPRLRGRRPLVGRERALTELTSLVRRDDVRLVTLLGPAGIGKTALAAALVEREMRAYPDGAFVVGLAGCVEADELVRALADAVGVPATPHALCLARVRSVLAPLRALLVLDGLDREASWAQIVDNAVADAEGVTVIVTARVRLRIACETVYEVGPLEVAASDRGARAGVAPSDAAKLFLRCAARSAGQSCLGEDDVPAVERVCRAVDGNPLAIELLAGWLDVLPLTEIEHRLATSWELLRSDDVDRPVNGRDLEAAIDEDWRQLPEQDRVIWMRLAVLPGSLDRTVIAAVAGTDWRGLRRLRDRGVLLQRGERFRLHALQARFARERADAAAIAGAWTAVLATWCERWASPAAVPSDCPRPTHEHDLEQGLGAWRWALAQRRWSAVADLAPVLLRSLRLMAWDEACQAAADEALAVLVEARGRLRDRALARVLALAPGSTSVVADNVRRARTLLQRQRDDVAVAATHAALVRAGTGPDEAVHVARAADAFRRCGDALGLALMLLEVGESAALAGRADVGDAHLQEALRLFEQSADTVGQARVHAALAITPALRGDGSEANEQLQRARALFDAAGGSYRGPATRAREAWVAALNGPCGRSLARWVERVGEGAGAGEAGWVVEARTVLDERRGDDQALWTAARDTLERLGEDVAPTLAVALAHQRLARALTARGARQAAVAHLHCAIALSETLRAPRLVPRIALCAAALAWALGDRERARAHLAASLRHVALEAAVRDDARRWCGECGIDAPSSELEPYADDAAVLARIDAWLEGLKDVA